MQLPFLASLVVLGVLASGCASYSYSPYVGTQGECPTSPGAFVKHYNGVPVYHGYPPRAYEVLGILTVDTYAETVERDAAAYAKIHKADAVLFLSADRYNAGNLGTHQTFSGAAGITTSTSLSTGINAAIGQCVLVKFK